MIKTNEASKTISKNIKKLRVQKKWTQSQLANKAEISGAALSKIEKGEGRVPTIVVIRKLAAALDVQPHEITGEKPVDASQINDKNLAFHREWGSLLDDLPDEDKAIIKNMAEHLSTKKNK